MLGFCKEELKSRRASTWRMLNTLFFLVTMLISFLVISAPVFLAVADAILPSALLSSSLRPETLIFLFSTYDFRYSLIDIPLISIVRSAVILCVYGLCDGPGLSRGPYLGITMFCSISSLIYVSLKASFVFSNPITSRASDVALFTSSLVLAIAHVVVAYRTSCKERRKMLVYKIDIEAVSACKNGFPRYQKIREEERVK